MSAAEFPVDPSPARPPAGRLARPLAAVAIGTDDGGRRRLVTSAFLSWLPIAAAVVVMTALVYGTVQQSMRSGADDPQIQMAGDLAAQLGGGAQPGSLVGTARVDLATSLAPYMIVFDEAGRPLASTGVLGGKVPEPPAGVLRAAARHRNALTWQPGHDVRSAIVVEPWRSDARAGTVLVGRSLTEVEKREAFLVKAAAAALVGGLGATALACLAAAWLRRRLTVG